MYSRFQKLCEQYKLQYADLRIVDTCSESINSDDFDINISSNSASGMGIRILKNGNWSISSSTERIPLKKLFADADRILSKEPRKIHFEVQKPQKDRYKTKFKIDPFSVSEEDKVNMLTEIKKNMDLPEIKTTKSLILFLKSKERFINSEGSDIDTEYCKSVFITTSIARRGDNIQPASYRRAFISGYEGINSIDVQRITKDLKKKTLRMLDAKLAPAGKFTLICDPELTGLFFHEALGHACEADAVLNKTSILRGMVGKKIASKEVSLSDDPRKKAWGHYKYDDEGIPASPTTVIEKGVLKGYLHSRETASQMKVQPTGNGRCDAISSFPIPRMSNLVIEKGDYNFDELVDMKKAIYAKGLAGGQVDIVKGNFIFGCEEAFLIEKGELSTPLREVSFSGNILVSLKKIDAIGEKVIPTSSGGTCGKKGQFVPVGEISPNMRIRSVIVGGRGN